MGLYRVPLEKPKPDIRRFLDAMSGKAIPDKVPMVEYLIDNAVMKPILENMMGRKWVETSDKTEYMGGQMDFSKENLARIDAWLPSTLSGNSHWNPDYATTGFRVNIRAVGNVI